MPCFLSQGPCNRKQGVPHPDTTAAQSSNATAAVRVNLPSTPARAGALVQWLKLPYWKLRVQAPLWPPSFKEAKCFFPAHL